MDCWNPSPVSNCAYATAARVGLAGVPDEVLELEDVGVEQVARQAPSHPNSRGQKGVARCHVASGGERIHGRR